MTPEQQRIAIAEACGWTVIEGILCDPKQEVRNGELTGEIDLNPTAPLPDYHNDLNAMHEAEKVLSLVQRDGYLHHLRSIVPTGLDDEDDNFLVGHATAAQRAEAFLRTMNLWVES